MSVPARIFTNDRVPTPVAASVTTVSACCCAPTTLIVTVAPPKYGVPSLLNASNVVVVTPPTKPDDGSVRIRSVAGPFDGLGVGPGLGMIFGGGVGLFPHGCRL